MKSVMLVVAVTFVILLTVTPARSQPASGSFHIIDSLALGGEGGWDYLMVDTAAERLYVSRGTRVQIVDLVKNALAGEIPGTTGVHGVALVTSEGKGFTSNGRDSSVTVFDLKSLATITKTKIDARNPDAILFDPFSGDVFTFNGGSGNSTVIDPKTNSVVGTIPLGGKPEFAVSDGRGHIYVNIEDKSMLTAIDARGMKVLNSWPLAPGEEPSGLAFDAAHRKLFSGCSNRLMVVVDADSGNVVATVPIGDGVDATAYDPVTHLAFSSNGEGTLTVVRQETNGRYAVEENVTTRRGARTMAVDVKTHRLYTVTGKFGAPPPATTEHPHPRPPLVPGSVMLYILGQ